MAISKDLTITVKEDRATLSEKMYVYMGDKGIDFYIKIENLKVDFTPNGATKTTINLLAGLINAYASVSVLKPNGTTFTREKFPIENDKIKFTITSEFTDELDDIGTYKLQIHLHDGNTEISNRISIPFVEFEVKELLS